MVVAVGSPRARQEAHRSSLRYQLEGMEKLQQHRQPLDGPYGFIIPMSATQFQTRGTPNWSGSSTPTTSPRRVGYRFERKAFLTIGIDSSSTEQPTTNVSYSEQTQGALRAQYPEQSQAYKTNSDPDGAATETQARQSQCEAATTALCEKFQRLSLVVADDSLQGAGQAKQRNDSDTEPPAWLVGVWTVILWVMLWPLVLCEEVSNAVRQAARGVLSRTVNGWLFRHRETLRAPRAAVLLCLSFIRHGLRTAGRSQYKILAIWVVISFWLACA